MTCGSCGKLSFGKNLLASKAMRLMRSDGISLKEAWKRVKSGKVKRSHKSRKSKKSRKSRKIKKSRKSRRSRRFGIVAGPGFKGQTSYSNAYANYYGDRQNFINSSNWWYPYAGKAIQSPQMLYKNAGPKHGPGN